MSTAGAKEPRRRGNRWVAGVVMLVLAALLIAAAVVGYVTRNTASATENLNTLRESAVVHAASEGLVNKIARDAKAERLKELRKNGDNGRSFREIGLGEVEAITGAAETAARQEAEALYSNPVIADHDALRSATTALEEKLEVYGACLTGEQNSFAEIYVALVDNVPSWTAISGGDDEALFAAMCQTAPALGQAENAHLKDGFVRLARDLAASEAARAQRDLESQLLREVDSEITDWADLAEQTDDALWAALTEKIPALAENPDFRAKALERARANIETVLGGGEVTAQDSGATDGVTPVSETQADYRYFTPSEALSQLEADKDSAHAGMWAQLTAIIPSLSEIKSKDQAGILEDLDRLLWPGDLSFATRYQSYTREVGSASAQLLTRLAGNAATVLILGIALMLLAMMLIWWKPLTRRFGVPRTIIFLFFVYLILAARYFSISIPLMMGNVLERMVMYGILTLAMMPGIQCGIGLNMGMTLGCIAGLLGIVLSLQFDMTGAGGLVFACVVGALIALPVGWLYSHLLNRMKGSEMTISTYVGFSFVSLMCIGWMMLPFNNPKIIWLLSGQGLRVTHSLLGSYGHLLDRLLSFEVLGMTVPTGGILFVGLCCLLMWLFSRTRVGIAMTAVGSNPRFAEASGIHVNSMRSLGTILSTVLAAIGIVIYSQSFGYAQLYTAPRQLGFIAASAILIGGASVSKAKVGHVLLGVFLFEGVLVFGQQIANAAVAGGGLSEVMRIMISNGIILYALTQTGGGRNE